MVGLLPDGAEEKEKEASWETWKLDLETGRIGGKIQGAEALKQAVMLRLLTPKYEHMIYGLSYGSELAGLIGKDGDYCAAAAKTLVEEALLKDNRIKAVRNVTAEREGDELKVCFTAESDWGAVEETASVRE